MPISTGFRTLKRDPKNSQGKLADLDGLVLIGAKSVVSLRTDALTNRVTSLCTHLGTCSSTPSFSDLEVKGVARPYFVVSKVVFNL
jgi:hypothetical protein